MTFQLSQATSNVRRWQLTTFFLAHRTSVVNMHMLPWIWPEPWMEWSYWRIALLRLAGRALFYTLLNIFVNPRPQHMRTIPGTFFMRTIPGWLSCNSVRIFWTSFWGCIPHNKGAFTWTTQCALHTHPIRFVAFTWNGFQVDAHSLHIGFNPPPEVVWKRIKRLFMIHARLRLPWDRVGLGWLGLWHVFCCNFQFCSCSAVGEERDFFSEGQEALIVQHGKLTYRIVIISLCYLFRRINASRCATRATKAPEQPSNIVLLSWCR